MVSLLSYISYSHLPKDGATHGGPRPDFPQGWIVTWKCKPNMSSLLGVGFGHGIYHGNRNQVGAVLGSILEHGLQERASGVGLSPALQMVSFVLVSISGPCLPWSPVWSSSQEGSLGNGSWASPPGRVSYVFALVLGCGSIVVVSDSEAGSSYWKP